MASSPLLERSSVTVVVTTFPETQRWLQERAAVSTGVFQSHKDQTEKLLACFEALQMQDPEAFAFCKTYIEQRIFWLEWEICAESGDPDSHHLQRRDFIENLRGGKPTIFFNGDFQFRLG